MQILAVFHEIAVRSPTLKSVSPLISRPPSRLAGRFTLGLGRAARQFRRARARVVLCAAVTTFHRIN